jgi:hypothetical protein
VFPVGELTISLEDGFADDHVVVAVDGVVVFDESQLTTRDQISLAREVTLDAPAGECRVRVRLPDRSLDSTLDVDTTRTPTVRVWVDRGGLQLRPTDSPRHA